MNKLKEYIQEKLVINKNSKIKKDISDQWANKDEQTKYKYDALYNILNLIKDKVDWNSETKNLYSIHFQTSLTANDLEKFNKEVYTNRYIDSAIQLIIKIIKYNLESSPINTFLLEIRFKLYFPLFALILTLK